MSFVNGLQFTQNSEKLLNLGPTFIMTPMKLIKFLCISIFAWSVFPSIASSQENIPIKEQKAQLKALLIQLDEVIECNDRYENQRLAKIDSLRSRMNAASKDSSEYYCDSLFTLFYGFQSDSALFYSKKGLEMSQLHNNQLMCAKSTLNRAKIYQMTGNYHACLTLLNKIDKNSLPIDFLVNMLSIYNGVYDALTSTTIDAELQSRYHNRAISYKDSILALDPDNIFVKCDRLLIDGDINSAVSLLQSFCDKLELKDPITGPAAYALSDVYRRQNITLQEKIYLAKSSISDLVNGNKEYMSLTRLALLLYEEADFKRAYSYTNKAIEDATYCRAKLRIEEIAPMVSIINMAYFRRMWMNYLYLGIGIVVVFLMASIMFWLVLYLRKQKVKLSQANLELSISQALEQEANRRTSEASSIKNTYITRLMLECIARIERLETYRKGLNRKALSREFEALAKELKSNAVVEQEWKSFYNVFDSTFLSLFPTFVSDLNNLLRPDVSHFATVKGVLSPELRIYALIRLGIDSTEEIASLLRYSRSTIYAYRSRNRLKAKNPSSFEEDVKNISSI